MRVWTADRLERSAEGKADGFEREVIDLDEVSAADGSN